MAAGGLAALPHCCQPLSASASIPHPPPRLVWHLIHIQLPVELLLLQYSSCLLVSNTRQHIVKRAEMLILHLFPCSGLLDGVQDINVLHLDNVEHDALIMRSDDFPHCNCLGSDWHSYLGFRSPKDICPLQHNRSLPISQLEPRYPVPVQSQM